MYNSNIIALLSDYSRIWHFKFLRPSNFQESFALRLMAAPLKEKLNIFMDSKIGENVKEGPAEILFFKKYNGQPVEK